MAKPAPSSGMHPMSIAVKDIR